MVYTPMLNERGGFESDLTITRLGAERFLLVTGAAQPTRDADWIARHTHAGESAVLSDVSGMTAVLSLMGPQARALLARAGGERVAEALAPQRLRFAATAEIDVGHARVRAARMSYVGGPGFELYVPIEMARHVWLALHAASDGLGLDDAGLVDAGYYALDALRIEAGRRAWGAELGPDETPLDAGTTVRGQARQARRLHRPGGAAPTCRRGAAQAPRHRRPRRRRRLGLGRRAPDRRRRGRVGELTSAGFSLRAGPLDRPRLLCAAAAASQPHAGSRIGVDLWGETIRRHRVGPLAALRPAAKRRPG